MSLLRAIPLFVLFALGSAVGASAQTISPPLPIPPQPMEPNHALDCLNNATTRGLMNQKDAFNLCQGAESANPFDCFQSAIRSLIDEKTAVRLCRCAQMTDRVACYNRAKTTTALTENEIIDLCTHDLAGYASRCDPRVPVG